MEPKPTELILKPMDRLWSIGSSTPADPLGLTYTWRSLLRTDRFWQGRPYRRSGCGGLQVFRNRSLHYRHLLRLITRLARSTLSGRDVGCVSAGSVVFHISVIGCANFVSGRANQVGELFRHGDILQSSVDAGHQMFLVELGDNRSPDLVDAHRGPGKRKFL